MWYHVKDGKTTMHKSECHPNTVRINVGIIYMDNYNGQEGVFVSGGTNKNGLVFDCLEFFELESEVNHFRKVSIKISRLSKTLTIMKYVTNDK